MLQLEPFSLTLVCTTDLTKTSQSKNEAWRYQSCGLTSRVSMWLHDVLWLCSIRASKENDNSPKLRRSVVPWFSYRALSLQIMKSCQEGWVLWDQSALPNTHRVVLLGVNDAKGRGTSVVCPSDDTRVGNKRPTPKSGRRIDREWTHKKQVIDFPITMRHSTKPGWWASTSCLIFSASSSTAERDKDYTA